MARVTSKTLRYIAITSVVIGIFALLQLKGLGDWTHKLVVVFPSRLASPVKRAAIGVRHTFSNIFSIRSLYVENADLKARVGQLEQRIAELSGLEAENDMLRSSLGFAARPPVAIEPCTVSGRDPEGLTQTLLLSCGSASGVNVGQGVITEGYLIGKVVLVTHDTATVRLLTASTTVVDVRIANRNVSGVLKGSFGSGLVIDFIPQTTEVLKGDLVTTAGINDRIPPDILVGSILDAVKEPGALFYKITVASPIDLRDVRYVHVLKP